MADAEAPSPEDVTRLLLDLKNGRKEAIDRLTPLVYGELRRLAASYIRSERQAATLQPTALVNEAYLRLVAQKLPDFESRSHFFGIAAHLMRQILVDHARKHRSAKRGAAVPKASLDDVVVWAPEKSAEIIALDDAMKSLEKVDPRKSKIIELRYFGGFSGQETAAALGVSVATIGREQRLAEAWLHRELSRKETG